MDLKMGQLVRWEGLRVREGKVIHIISESPLR